ncbi:MAG: class I SAM-dependent methyltransferase [Bacteroidota bacterium]
MNKKKDINPSDHWNKVYANKDTELLGWYEDDVSPTLRLVRKSGAGPNSRILNIGAGSTMLVDSLLALGYTNLIATDISEVALMSLQERIGDKSNMVDWIVDDLTRPSQLNKLEPVDLWIDRAVLHFFTERNDQDTYFALMKQMVHKFGYVILAQFSAESADMCSGLPVHRYSLDTLNLKMGSDFKLITSFDHLYSMPSGDLRPYIYTLYQRIS